MHDDVNGKADDLRRCSIDHAEQLLDEFIRHLFVVFVLFCGIIEKDMTFVLVVVQILQVEIVSGSSSCTLIAVQSTTKRKAIVTIVVSRHFTS